ncbi:MAG: hypothetical protein M3Y56_13730, partial [Armatimonadota bacterium]|nr:hypothetical protein [Armatimonadota bacterium]
MILNSAQLSSFNDALNGLAEQGHVAIVAEGVPLHSTLAAKDVPSVAGQSLPLVVMVNAVASAYDYEAHRSGKVFVLQKRYSDSGDLPSLTIGEWTACLQQIVRLTDPLNPHVEFSSPT